MKKMWIASGFIVLLIVLYLTPKLPQDEAYHLFADCRCLWKSIPNTLDVLSNVPFFIVGILGLSVVLQSKLVLGKYFTVYLTFFVGVFFVGLGSSWYHWQPNSSTLIWDRLPMTVAFMSLTSFVLGERVDKAAGYKLFPWFVIVGIFSVFWWAILNDLRLYALVQFLPLLALPYILWRYPAKDNRWLWWSFLFYGAAKIFEATDRQIFEMSNELIAGHSIKHLMAAISTLMIYFKVKEMKIKTESNNL